MRAGGRRRRQLHAEFERLNEVTARLQPGVPAIALGSGTVTDLAKHACFTYQERTGEQLPLVLSAPPLISVLAYSARMAVIAKDGVKRTWPSRLSDALVFDLAALAEAPRHLTLGRFLGDLAPYVHLVCRLEARRLARPGRVLRALRSGSSRTCGSSLAKWRPCCARRPPRVGDARPEDERPRRPVGHPGRPVVTARVRARHRPHARHGL